MLHSVHSFTRLDLEFQRKPDGYNQDGMSAYPLKFISTEETEIYGAILSALNMLVVNF